MVASIYFPACLHGVYGGRGLPALYVLSVGIVLPWAFGVMLLGVGDGCSELWPSMSHSKY